MSIADRLAKIDETNLRITEELSLPEYIIAELLSATRKLSRLEPLLEAATLRCQTAIETEEEAIDQQNKLDELNAKQRTEIVALNIEIVELQRKLLETKQLMESWKVEAKRHADCNNPEYPI